MKLARVLICGTVAAIAMSGCSTSSIDTAASSIPVATSVPAPVVPPQPPEACPGAVNWPQTDRYVGKTVTIKGPVQSVRYEPSSTGQPTFLNVGEDYPSNDRIAVVIWGQNRSTFSPKPEVAYRDETVCITAEVGTYRGVTQMTVTRPNQVQVV
jgi:hypothetical protein